MDTGPPDIMPYQCLGKPWAELGQCQVEDGPCLVFLLLTLEPPTEGGRRTPAGLPVGIVCNSKGSPFPDIIWGGYFTLQGNSANEYVLVKKGRIHANMNLRILAWNFYCVSRTQKSLAINITTLSCHSFSLQ